MRASIFTAKSLDVYGTKIIIVRMIVVVRSDGGVFVSPGGGGGGTTTPGELICPAKAITLSVKHRIVAAQVWRKVFICWLPIVR